MKYSKIVLLLFFFLSSVLSDLYGQIPSVKIENSKNEVINTADFIDKKTPFIISFWATTCKPCILELDAINELMPDWLEDIDFRVIAVSTDDSRSVTRAKALAEGHGWSDFTMVYDKNQDFMRAMNVTLTPQIFLFDKDGKMVYSHTGYTPGSELKLWEALKKLKE